MQIIDCDTKTHLTGVDAALEALLAQKAADDDTPISDWFDDLPKVWRNGYLYVGNIACGYTDGRMVPGRERFEETDGELQLLTSEVLPNGERRLRFRAANSPRWYSVTPAAVRGRTGDAASERTNASASS